MTFLPNWKSVFTGLFFVNTFAISGANAASFDCNKAATWVEKTICSNADLSVLDEKMANKYKDDVASSDGNEPYVKAMQKQWLQYQRNTCATAECLIREHKERLTGEYEYGVFEDYTVDYNLKGLPTEQAFGEFGKEVTVSVYNPDSPNQRDIFKETNSLTIHKIPTKPYLSIIDGDFVFTNAHMCYLNDEKAVWSENHWVINNDELHDSCELRLYTVNGKLLIKDIDNQCRKIYCGMRGYFDDTVLERK